MDDEELLEKEDQQDQTKGNQETPSGSDVSQEEGNQGGNTSIQPMQSQDENSSDAAGETRLEKLPETRLATVPSTGGFEEWSQQFGKGSEDENAAGKTDTAIETDAGKETDSGKQEDSPVAEAEDKKGETDSEGKTGTVDEGAKPISGEMKEGGDSDAKELSEVQDEIATPIAGVALETLDAENKGSEKKEEEEEDFDKFDANLLSGKHIEEEEKGKGKKEEENKELDEDQQKRAKEIGEHRKSPLYKAVVLARLLEKGGGNPVGEEKSRPGRFSRFFNSSKYDATADALKIAGAASGALGTLDSTYATSTVSKGISLASNAMALVTSIRDIIKKIKLLWKTRKVKMTAQKALTVVGLVSDFGVLVGKSCALAKTIGGFFGKTFSKVLDVISLIANSATQIGGMVAGSVNLAKQGSQLREMDTVENENKAWNEVEKEYHRQQRRARRKKREEEEKAEQAKTDEAKVEQPADQAKADEAKVEQPADQAKADEAKEEQPAKENVTDEKPPEEANKEAPPEEVDKKEAKEKKTGEKKAAKKGAGEKKADEAAESKGEKPDKELLEERRQAAVRVGKSEYLSNTGRDSVLAYLLRRRKISSLHSNIINGAMGLMAATLGFGSSIATGVNLGVGNEKSGKAAKYMGLAASFGGVAAPATKFAVNHHNKSEKLKHVDETVAIKEQLPAEIKSLEDNKYGLKGIHHALKADPNNEGNIKRANEANKRYTNVSKIFENANVNYAELLKAKDMEAFKKQLVEGI